jgi:RNA polymerase sigma-70 factor (ECF subfamily)
MTVSTEARPAKQPVDEVSQEAETKFIRQAQAGDAAAWVALVQDHQEAIYRLAYLVLRDASEAEDVAQEVFVKAFLALDSFDIERPIRPWLARIAINLARNRRRSVGRYLKHLQRLLLTEPEPAPDVHRLERKLESDRQADSLWSAVGHLSKNGQEVVVLRYFMGASEAEMAEVLDVARGTVKSRLSRSLQRLRQIISSSYPELLEWLETE